MQRKTVVQAEAMKVDCSLVWPMFAITRVKKKEDKPCKACINTHILPPVCLSVFKDVRNLNQHLRTVQNVNSRTMFIGRSYEILFQLLCMQV